MPDTFKNKYGPWALVTGAARGLGLEFSRQIARRGLGVVMLDCLVDELQVSADSVREESGREVVAINADLCTDDIGDVVEKQTSGREIGLLVNNATFGPVGLFFDRPLDEKLDALAVNTRAPMILTHKFGEAMLERGRGGIVMLSSASALQGTAYVANYAATKAYNLTLGEGLWAELRHRGVDVMAVMPGPTATPGYESSKPAAPAAKRMKVMSAAEVVRQSLDTLGARPSFIPGRRNRVNAFVSSKLMSRTAAVKLLGRVMHAMYGVRP